MPVDQRGKRRLRFTVNVAAEEFVIAGTLGHADNLSPPRGQNPTGIAKKRLADETDA